MKKILLYFIILSLPASLFAHGINEERTAHALELIKNHPQKLFAFLQTMPKGGDLHNHVSGTAPAEYLVHLGKPDNLCVDPQTYTVKINAACEPQHLLHHATTDPTYLDALIDSWSMRHFQPGLESGHDHFFATFSKFGQITSQHQGELIAQAAISAAEQNISYLELMLTLENGEATRIGKSIGWDPDFVQMRHKLLAANFGVVTQTIINNLDKNDAKIRSVLHCDTENPSACQVTLRYISQIPRTQAPEIVFAHMLAGFEAASKDKRIVGLNLVQPEDNAVAVRDYTLQMQMLGYLRKLYPNVHISLHAGELTEKITSPDALTSHISEAIHIAKADRIGHGVDIAQENNAEQTLIAMAKQHVLVEIGLSSNDMILGVKGKSHPLPLYVNYGVPVAISTDDPGVSRSNHTKEFVRAVLDHHFDYLTLKNFSRNSITYAFLPGKSLWKNHEYKQMINDCAQDHPESNLLSPACQKFLSQNEKASMQWDLEKRFTAFELHY